MRIEGVKGEGHRCPILQLLIKHLKLENVVYVVVVRGRVKLCEGRGVGWDGTGRGGERWRGVRWEGVARRGRVG